MVALTPSGACRYLLCRVGEQRAEHDLREPAFNEARVFELWCSREKADLSVECGGRRWP